MNQYWVIVISYLVLANGCEDEDVDLSFPGDFIIGAATAAYQIEGAWNASGSIWYFFSHMAAKVDFTFRREGGNTRFTDQDKGQSVWDYLCHTRPELIADGSTGDDAAKFYYTHHYKEDVQLMKSIGMIGLHEISNNRVQYSHHRIWRISVLTSNFTEHCPPIIGINILKETIHQLRFFRFSIAWTRVLPTGFPDVISQDGLRFYEDLIAELLANGIQPVVTLTHFDHPQSLAERGGWINELMVDWFADYARIVFEKLGMNVKIWVTINEPNVYCRESYPQKGQSSPANDPTNDGAYTCMHHMLKAHAKVYRMYDEEFRQAQQGEIGIVISCPAYLPRNSSDTEAAETAFQFRCGWVAHPIYKGDYPEIMKERIAMVSKAQGYEKSRLPEFSKEWIITIKGTADYIGINYYTSSHVRTDPAEVSGKHNSDQGVIESEDPECVGAAAPSTCVHTPGFGYLLRQIKDEYGNPAVRVMESGYTDNGGLCDVERIQYHYYNLKELITAVKRDHCKVKSYSIWSAIDTFEWIFGYGPKYGIFRVDYDDADKPRTARFSAYWWKHVLESHKLQKVPSSSECKIYIDDELL